MLFNSLTFVAFFTIVLAFYWSMRSWPGRKNLLLVASYIFYGAWNPPFAALLFSTTALDFYLGRKMGKVSEPRERRIWLWISVAVNLSMLGFFKYGNFLLENFTWVLARGGIQYKPPHLDVFLPIGISFYTFHSLSYTLDIYRGVMKPTRSLRDFTLAVSFFPQLVAGPIVRAGDFLPQLEAPPNPQRGRFLWGLFLMTLGLFEKVVLADTLLASSADHVFGYAGPLMALDSWTGVIAFWGKSSATSRVTPPVRSAPPFASGFISRITSDSPTQPSGSPISGGAGTFRFLLFCATTFTFRSAAIVTARRAR